MTDKDAEKIAELVFQKMVAKQAEWDAQNGQIYYESGIKLSDRETSLSQIVALNLVKAAYIDAEEYERAAEIQKEINKIRDSLK
jgi:protein-arginine kinase activator protein McsA